MASLTEDNCLTECELLTSVCSNTDTRRIMKPGKVASFNCRTSAPVLAGVQFSQNKPAVFLSTCLFFIKTFISSAKVNCFTPAPGAGHSQHSTTRWAKAQCWRGQHLSHILCEPGSSNTGSWRSLRRPVHINRLSFLSLILFCLP